MAELAAAPAPPLLLYDADHVAQKYDEAVTTAVEVCAAATAGQTCFICMCGAEDEGIVRMCACRGTTGFAHVSCLAKQAKILREEAEANNFAKKVKDARWDRWDTCGLCEQRYDGAVACALGWACWKTYLGRPEEDQDRRAAMSVLGNGLDVAGHLEDALSASEAGLSMEKRFGASRRTLLTVQGNLAHAYQSLRRLEDALSLHRDVYSGYLKLKGEEHSDTLFWAVEYASCLANLQRFEEAKSLMRKTLPVARRVLGESDQLLLDLGANYARTLYLDPAAPLDDLREAVTTLEEIERTVRRAFGSAHPLTMEIEVALRNARAALRTREETQPSGGA